MARARVRDDGMPEQLARFVEAEWPDDHTGECSDRKAVAGCTPAQARVWRRVFAHRRYVAARVAWARAFGAPVLPILRAGAEAERAMLGPTS